MSCAHGMPTAGSCVVCMDEGLLPPPPRPEPESIDFEFIAKFTGQCPICDLPTRAGRPIAKTTRDRYVHPGCLS